MMAGMKMLLFLFGSTMLVPSANSQTDNLVVETTTGKVRGMLRSVLEYQTTAFLGIPFAESPDGRLRFKPPVPKNPWNGIYNATSLRNDCRQSIDTSYPGFSGSEQWNVYNQSEDCLALNIWVPSRNDEEKLPVMVWIYGGGFYSGGISLGVYDGATLAAVENVIVVSLNYRVSLFGFLALEHPDAPGNVGLMDQSMALEWIYGNIGNFGGNADQITLFGESAGSASITYHMISPQSRPYFNRAILQSGSCISPWALIDGNESVRRGLKVAQRVGCYDTSADLHGPSPSFEEMGDIISCLRDTDAQRLVDKEWVITTCWQFPFAPVVDGTFITESPAATLAKHDLKPIEIMAGENANEGSFFMLYALSEFHRDTESLLTREQFSLSIADAFPDLNNFSRDAIEFMYIDWLDPENGAMLRDNCEHAVGDRAVKCALHKFARNYADAGNKVYMYHFDQRAGNNPWPEWMGVMHGDEIMFAFGLPLHEEFGYSEGDKAVSRKMMKLWANFARTGNPNKRSNDSQELAEGWPTFSKDEQRVYLLRNDTMEEPQVNIWDRSNVCAFWTEYIPNLDTQTANIDDAERKWKEEFHAWSTKYMVDWKAEFNHYVYKKKSDGNCQPQLEEP
ncbi:cholinesterase-like isoform X2 [Apostichopus japonicus]